MNSDLNLKIRHETPDSGLHAERAAYTQPRHAPSSAFREHFQIDQSPLSEFTNVIEHDLKIS